MSDSSAASLLFSDAWLAPTDVCPLAPSELHVWRATLAEYSPSLEQLLSADEQSRAKKYLQVADRQRFVMGRAALRWLTGQYQERDPGSLVFATREQGKPYLVQVSGAELPLFFNVSASGDEVLLAFTRAGEVGVDIECWRTIQDLSTLLARICAPVELRHIQQMSSAAQEQALFDLWTCKEAILKATGSGLMDDPSRVEIDLSAAMPTAAPWRIVRLPTTTGYSAAFAVGPSVQRVATFQLPAAFRRCAD